MAYRYRKPGINPILILVGVNVAVFIATMINQSLIYMRFGLIPAFVTETPWTLFTYMFVHASLWHILFNMLTLYFLGTFTKNLIGETSFLMTYFIGGIVGGLFFFLLSPLVGTSFNIVVGASGAVYALGGLLVVMRPNTRVMVFPIPVPIPLWIAILVGFILVSFFPNVAWQAHLGGLVYGVAVGFYFSRKERRRY